MQTTATSNEPNVSLPRPLRQQMQRVQERIDRRKSEMAGEELPAPPAPAAEPPQGEEQHPGSGAPAPEPQATAPAAPDPRENDAAYWKHRYETSQGMLHSLRDQRRRELEDAERQIDELRNEIQTLKAQAPAPADQQIDIAQFFTPEQVEQLGEDQCRSMVKAAVTAARTQVQSVVEAELQPIRERAKRTAKQQEEDARERFVEALAEKVPNYADFDADPDWLAWLAEEDPATGELRQDLLTRFVQRRDVHRTARMFREYEASKAPPPAPPPVAPAATAAPPAGNLPAQRPAGGAPTDAEVKDFYKRAAIGRVTDKERVEFEARLQLRQARAA